MFMENSFIYVLRFMYRFEGLVLRLFLRLLLLLRMDKLSGDFDTFSRLSIYFLMDEFPLVKNSFSNS